MNRIYMNRVKSFLTCITLLFIVNSTYAIETQYIDDGIVQYYCNANTSNIYFDADSLKAPTVGMCKKTVSISPLLLQSEEDEMGNRTSLGSKKAIQKCGSVKLVFESGFYNSNPQGMLGLLNYPLISVIINNNVIINRNPLNLCDSSGTRETCPTEFSIQAIEIVKSSKNLYQVKVKKALPLSNGDSVEFKTEYLKVN